MKGTDTGLAFKGEAEWAIAGLLRLGVPEDEASATVSLGTDSDPGKVPPGVITVAFRVCKSCADQAGMPVGLMAFGQLPTIAHRGDR
jgi:hypothetical protein